MIISSLPLLLVLQLTDVPRIDGFRYVDCADQFHGLPLLNCAVIEISSNLMAVHIRDTGEHSYDLSGADPRYRALVPSILPIAIPTSGYTTTERWEHRGNSYVKVSTQSEVMLPWQHTSDVIVVAPTPADTAALPNTARGLRGTAKLIFRYSELDGVTAIAFVDPSRGNGEVFYCAQRPCLFARDDDVANGR